MLLDALSHLSHVRERGSRNVSLVWTPALAYLPRAISLSMSDIHDQLAKLDRQIIDLIGERMDLYRVALEEDEDGVARDHIGESLAEWEEAAEEKGWSPGLMSKICRGIVEICRSGASDE